MAEVNIVEVMARAACKAVSGYPRHETVATMMRAALAALEEAGMVVVPVVPSEARVKAGVAVLETSGRLRTDYVKLGDAELVRDIYAAVSKIQERATRPVTGYRTNLVLHLIGCSAWLRKR